MSFPFTLPTASAVAFTHHYTSHIYPSLPLACSTHRGILRDALKEHKRLPPAAQGANIKHIISATTEYLSYLLFLQDALNSGDACPLPNAPEIETEWRPTLSSTSRFGVRKPARRKEKGIEYEMFWVFSTLAYAHTIQARTLLMEFLSPSTYSTDSSVSPLLPQATNHLLTSASIFNHLLTLKQPAAAGAESSIPVDISQSMLSSLASISTACATLLAVLKTDPYPTYLALTSTTSSSKRSKNDAYTKEYLYNPPPPPTGVKALLYSRLCIAASEHAAKAQGAISSLVRAGEISEDYVRYLDDLRKVARARGCRFLGVDAESQGRLGEGLGWIKLGKEILYGSVSSSSSSSSGSGDKDLKEKISLSSTMEKLRLSTSSSKPSSSPSGSTSSNPSAGGLPPHLDPCSIHSELQTIQALEQKWSKTNDKLIFERVPPTNSLVAKIPSGREVHTVKKYFPVRLEDGIVNRLRKGGVEGAGTGAGTGTERYGEDYWATGGGGESSDEDEGRGTNRDERVGYY